MKNRKLAFAAIAASLALSLTTGANLRVPARVAAQDALYTSCEADKLTAPIGSAAAATEAATEAATAAATEAPAATVASDATAAADNIVFLSIVGSESQACYLASETFLENNMMNMPAGFNGAVGITQTIAGDIALDLNNLANSQIGDITINISEFKSDSDRRDGFIRQNFLQSNQYPYATLKNATPIGLPAGAYTDGTTVTFQIKGTLNVHNTDRETTFDATGTYKDGVLVIKAWTDLKMSEFGIEVPNIGGLLKVDDDLRLEVNLVARAADAAAATATPS